MHNVAKDDDATEEKDGEEPGLMELGSVDGTRCPCSKCDPKNVVDRHSIALPPPILCMKPSISHERFRVRSICPQRIPRIAMRPVLMGFVSALGEYRDK